MGSTRSLSGRFARGRNLRVSILLLLAGACGGSSTDAGPAPSVPPECTPVRSPGVLSAQHVADGTTATYNSTPPSSGQHYARPAQAGGYAEPIKNETQVHNLEHGYVIIQYRRITDAQRAALKDVILKDPKMIILAPYPAMEPMVAFTSWGKIQTCDAWTETAPALARYFIARHRDNAPESIP